MNKPTFSTSLLAEQQSELEESIRREIKQIVQQIYTIVEPEAIVLGGSLGRGEGRVYEGPNGQWHLNDYDLWIILRKGQQAAVPELQALTKKYVKQLNADYLDIAVLFRSQLSELPLKQVYFDLRQGGQVIAGDSQVLGDMPTWKARDLPPHEGLVLFFNRWAGMIGHLSVPAASRAGQKLDTTERTQVLHLLSACGDAALMAVHRYHHLFAEKRDRAPEVLAQIPELTSEEQKTVLRAYDAKLRGEDPEFCVAYQDVATYAHVGRKVFRWCLQQHLARASTKPLSLLELLTRYFQKHGQPRRQRWGQGVALLLTKRNIEQAQFIAGGGRARLYPILGWLGSNMSPKSNPREIQKARKWLFLLQPIKLMPGTKAQAYQRAYSLWNQHCH